MPPTMSPRPRRRPAPSLAGAAVAAALVFLAALLAAPSVAAASPYRDGERVQFAGVVTDAAGKPVPGAQVVLEAARSYLSLRQLRRTARDVRRVSATARANGEYTLEWPWDDSYNHFELLAGATVRRGREESLEVLEREDVSERVLAGSPVVSAIVIHNRGFIDRLREFVASVQSLDERKAYEEMGTPDDVKRVNYAGRPQDTEVSWWYFDAGKVYRFRNGRLEQVDRFDPVQRF
jgi:hypothetical protein